MIVNGDGADFYAASQFKKDPKRKFLVKEEADEAAPVLQAVRDLAEIGHWLDGNHEARFLTLLRDKAPELEGITTVKDLLRLHDWDTFTPYGKHLRLGKMYFTHALHSHGINAVRDALKAYQHSVCIGHVHRMQLEYAGNATGERRVGLSFGWMGDVEQIDYAHEHVARTQWQTGFGHIEVYEGGLFHPHQHPIVKGKVLG